MIVFMTERKVFWLTMLLVLLTPVITASISYLLSMSQAHSGDDGIAILTGLLYGFIGLFASIILGPITGLIFRNSSSITAPLLGYIVPAVLAVIVSAANFIMAWWV